MLIPTWMIEKKNVEIRCVQCMPRYEIMIATGINLEVSDEAMSGVGRRR